jgi:hypothetical protein
MTKWDYIKFIAADFQPNGLPDLASEDGQKFYDLHIAWSNVVIVDNLSTVCRGLKENDADSFTSVLEWMLRLRKAGKSVVLIHHSGKGGTQRGSSRKEDILDTVIALRRPPDFNASQGARFEVRTASVRTMPLQKPDAFITCVKAMRFLSQANRACGKSQYDGNTSSGYN